MVKRINFNCFECGISTSKTAPNYYKQKRKLHIDLCGSCAIKRNNKLSIERIIKFNKRNNLLNKPITNTIIIHSCAICKKIRHINYRKSNSNICSSCAIKKSHLINKLTYNKASFNRINNKDFGKKVSNGLLLIPKEKRVSSAINASRWWKDSSKKAVILAKRLTEEYRQKMRDIWNRPGFKEKMAKIRLQQPKTSSQQHILYSILDDLKIKYYDDKSINCKVGWYTFDCRIDPQLGIKIKKPLLIEVQGDYWHNQEKQIIRDKQKATYLKTYFSEYELKYLWEHEFDNKNRIINLLEYWLGLNIQFIKQINLNIINEKIIDYKEAELFISKYHYAGRIGRSGLNIGYYYNNELIGVIIYCNPTRQETAIKQNIRYDQILELSRLAIHPQYQIKNLASNIISRSINYIKQNKQIIELLVSFSDSTYNHSGIIYKASNWKLDGIIPPDYWYADNKGYICHKKTLWNKAKKMCMTESEYCNKFNYIKIWGGSKNRYIYNIKHQVLYSAKYNIKEIIT